MSHSLRLLRLARRNPSPLNHLPGILRPRTPPWRLWSSACESTSAPNQPSQRVSAIVDEISGLTLLEVADLTEVLRKRLGVEEMPFMAVMAPGTGFGGGGGGQAGASAAAEKVEEKKEKTAFDLKLESFDAASKIKIIKEVRSFTDLGLKEAKDLVEKAPAVLKTGVPKEEAEKIAEKLKELGAKVVLE
ncbi:Ribosomal protein L7/L12 protein [Dioscorea alata]|uniref:Ribosomal protein L7/L12 protein n=1 Tax=Dioscorea alata TaxID=55571 RepID=A0ACB7TWA9_DIOAL|nr:Ribosomal protein L7/L12 protein [Dioscorea alata]